MIELDNPSRARSNILNRIIKKKENVQKEEIRLNEKTDIKYAIISDAGKVREKNEDAVISRKIEDHYLGKRREFYIFALGDGVGGMKSGEKASYMAIKNFVAAIEQNLDVVTEDGHIMELISMAVKKSNNEILNVNAKKSEDEKIGSTFLGTLILGNTVYYMSSGDSPLYKYSKGKLQKVTRDHRVKGSNRIYSCLGISDEFQTDSGMFRLANGDSILLCSDGLTDMVGTGLIKKVINEYKNDPERVCKNLLKEALDAGGKDNISIVFATLR